MKESKGTSDGEQARELKKNLCLKKKKYGNFKKGESHRQKKNEASLQKRIVISLGEL